MDTTTATLSAILDKAITLKDGGVIIIPCASYEEMEIARTKLYKLRNQLSKKFSSLARALDIKREGKKGSWTLYISKESTIKGVLIIEDGETRPFELKTEEEAVRKNKLIKEDIKDIEDIKEDIEKTHLNRDFDEVAAEIEATQNLETEKED